MGSADASIGACCDCAIKNDELYVGRKKIIRTWQHLAHRDITCGSGEVEPAWQAATDAEYK